MIWWCSYLLQAWLIRNECVKSVRLAFFHWILQGPVWIFVRTLQTVLLTRGSMMINYLVEECFTVLVIKSLLWPLVIVTLIAQNSSANICISCFWDLYNSCLVSNSILFDPGVTRKTRIIDVVYNASNNELVRTKTLVKNCIVQVDSTPFRQW